MLYYLTWIINISSHLEVFCKKSVLKNVAKFPGKHLCQSLFFYTVPELKLKLFKRRNSLTGFFLWIIHLLLAASDRFRMFLRGKKNRITQKIYFNMEEYYKKKSLELKDLKVKCKQRGSKKDIKYIENDSTRRSTYSTRGTSAVILVSLKSVCNFQSMKSLVKLNSLFLKFFCYIT